MNNLSKEFIEHLAVICEIKSHISPISYHSGMIEAITNTDIYHLAGLISINEHNAEVQLYKEALEKILEESDSPFYLDDCPYYRIWVLANHALKNNTKKKQKQWITNLKT
jgi:hypothetical protein